ncbi:patatin-like phospholipase family protein [Inquilinus limosus]|uniref:patatin-like phospholipase family protein n=1 Tax=Inquilinus limosus TaxID=171674 RepID=UPI003F181BB3
MAEGEAAKPIFEIGLALAGAISAGAYSAGVLDFLFQALDRWEQAKKTQPDDVPNHSVCIKVVAGASAGAITGALGMAALAGGLRPPAGPGQRPVAYTLPALHDAWVVMPDLASPTGGADLLSISDLQNQTQPISSILNSAILRDIADRALRLPAGTPAVGNLPYIGAPLHMYLMVSNMRGVPYTVTFKGQANQGHGMLSHGDRLHYILDGLGAGTAPNNWCAADPAITLGIKTLPSGAAAMPNGWRDYAEAALASAAFPIGLASREIDSDADSYNGRQWPALQGVQGASIKPSWPASWNVGPGYHFRYLTIDGGLIDNEPFEYAHQGLLPNNATANPRAGNTAVRAVVMIDPFPEPPALGPEAAALDGSLRNVAMSLFPVLKNQARFKLRELVLALDETVYSRWLIAPRRGDDGKVERYAIATGLLGGFGGFADQSFRDHDYQLGRRNCQKFLRDVFTVGAQNPIMQTWSPTALGNPAFSSLGAAGPEYCIIPLVGDAAEPISLPPWPQIPQTRLATLERRIAERASMLVPGVIRRQIKTPHIRLALRTLWSLKGASQLADFIHWTVLSDLVRRDQIVMPWSLTDDERQVYAELAAPKYDYRTIAGLVVSTGLTDAAVAGALVGLAAKQKGLIWQGKVRDRDGEKNGYALSERRPGWFSRNAPWVFGEPSVG